MAKKPKEIIIRTPAQSRIALKRQVRIFYDLQRLRIQTAGRTYDRSKDAGIELHPLDIQSLDNRAQELHNAEKNALKDIIGHLRSISFYTDILDDKKTYKGLGPTMAAVILSSFDIENEDTVSKMWAFAGLRPMPALRCVACHNTVVMEEGRLVHDKKIKNCKEPPGHYASGKAQKPVAGQKLPYNSWLRTKLVGVLGPCLIKCSSPWRKYYDDYKHRKQSAGWGISDGHRHNAAMRYMIKMLLLDLYVKWRTHLELPVRKSYQEEKLGHIHSAPATRPVRPIKQEEAEKEEPTMEQRMVEEEMALLNELDTDLN